MKIGFLGLLTIVFITLKLIGYIAWSWWWVLAPIWIPWAIVIVIFIIGAILVGSAGPKYPSKFDFKFKN